MLEAIKKAALDAITASNPVNIMFGDVRLLSPLTVNVDQRFNLTADFLIISETLTRYEITIGSTQYVIREGLKVGDKVILLRMQGGQKYLIVDKVVSG